MISNTSLVLLTCDTLAIGFNVYLWIKRWRLRCLRRRLDELARHERDREMFAWMRAAIEERARREANQTPPAAPKPIKPLEENPPRIFSID